MQNLFISLPSNCKRLQAHPSSKMWHGAIKQPLYHSGPVTLNRSKILDGPKLCQKDRVTIESWLCAVPTTIPRSAAVSWGRWFRPSTNGMVPAYTKRLITQMRLLYVAHGGRPVRSGVRVISPRNIYALFSNIHFFYLIIFCSWRSDCLLNNFCFIFASGCYSAGPSDTGH